MIGSLATGAVQPAAKDNAILATILDLPLDLMLIIVLLAGLCFQTLTILYLYSRLRRRSGEECRPPGPLPDADCREHPDAVVVRVSEDGVVVGLSTGARRFFGSRAEGVVGRKLVGTLVPARESTDRDLASLWSSLLWDKDGSQELECECLAEGGKRPWMRWMVRRPRSGANRDELSCLGVETTGGRERDRDLALARQALEQAEFGVGMAELDGTIMFCNPAWARMHGFGDPGELVGGNLAMVHSPEQMIQEVIPFNREVVARGFKQGEMGHVRQDGTLFTCWMSVTLIKDGKDEPAGYVVVGRDVAAEKEARDKIRNTQAWLDSLMESSDDPILVADRMAKPVLYNKAYAENLGKALGLEMEPGLRPTDLLGPKDKALWDEYHQRVLGGERVRFEYEITFPDETVRLFDITLNPVRCEGEVIGFSQYCRYITTDPVRKVKRKRTVLTVEPDSGSDQAPSEDGDE